MGEYLVEYGSNSQRASTIISTSRNARRHGEELLGSQGNGWVEIWTMSGEFVSAAMYTPQMGGRWYNVELSPDDIRHKKMEKILEEGR